MMTGEKKRKARKHLSTVMSLGILLAGFLVILFGMNVYRYLKTRDHFATVVITDINRREVDKLKGFFNNVNEKLLLIRDLAKNGELSLNNAGALNRKFIPFLKNNSCFSGVILADEKGREYFLYGQGKAWITRVTLPATGGSRMIFKEWRSPEDPVKTWEKKSNYDPRKRPWFRKPGKERTVYWSPLYEFYESKKPGVTASISWEKSGGGDGFLVFALDIPVEQVQKLLASRGEKKGEIFLFNSQRDYFVTASEVGYVGENSRQSEISTLLSHVIQSWKKNDRPADRFVPVSFGEEKWLASLRPLFDSQKVIWVGFVGPEKVLLSDLKKTMFRVDTTDIVVALAGGALLLLLFWKIGGLGTADSKAVVDPVIRLHGYINEGEGAGVEFKSTVRTNLRTGKKGKEIELAWLKAVAGFLNSGGGALLIGVSDDGRIVGIERDDFENEDKCLLHIKNLINQHIGAEFSSFINISLVKAEDKTVVMIECEPARDPVFLKIGKNEEFYIRSGPSSVKLLPSQMISYVLQNMKKRK